MLKAKHNLESRIRTLKKDWAIIYGMLSEKNNSGFGWDEHRQMVVIEDEVWKSYISDVANQRNPEEGSNDNGCEVDASLDEMNVSATQSRPYNPNKVGSTFPKKKKKNSEASGPDFSTSLIHVATLLGDNIRTGDLELSRSIASKCSVAKLGGWKGPGPPKTENFSFRPFIIYKILN
ncbi:Chaperone DnaK [Gossypium australe]|uniref:Chaperone DnaK n=1 Tax=Gossypium australe TaxID=47621 RepID=A0A5B6UFP2_9ROSI|nr:Chaperone DnaK [Gossypium australe]